MKKYQPVFCEVILSYTVIGVHIIFFVPIGCPLCTVWNIDRQAGLKFGNGYLGIVPLPHTPFYVGKFSKVIPCD